MSLLRGFSLFRSCWINVCRKRSCLFFSLSNDFLLILRVGVAGVASCVTVSEVSRPWVSSTDKGAYQLGKAIYEALSSIGKGNATVALVETKTEIFPQLGEQQTVIITVGDKEFSLGVPDAASGASVTIEEKLIAK